MEDSDIFLSYDLTDSYQAVQDIEVNENEIPESYKSVGYENMCDPVAIKKFLEEQGFNVVTARRTGETDLKEICSMIRNAKVFIGCLSDKYVTNKQCCMEFQYAKTSLQKPVIPLVVGDGSHNWVASVIGMLIAGELYISFQNKDVESAKNAELLANIRHHIPDDEGGKQVDENDTLLETGPADIFLSYCWTNSLLAESAKQISTARGNKLSDPRILKSKLAERGYKVWLDIERLESANSDAGLFGQIVKGLKSSRVVIPCISDEYAKSQNCRMEFQFSLRSLRKPVIPVVVGGGEDWKTSVVGALLTTHDKEPIYLTDIETENQLEGKIIEILRNYDLLSSPTKMQSSHKICARSFKPKYRSDSSSDTDSDASDAPDSASDNSGGLRRAAIRPIRASAIPNVKRTPGMDDRVVSHYENYSYYMATVADYDIETMTYTVDWDDDDPTHRVQPFDDVAIDAPPDINDISEGTVIFFPQGHYFCNKTNARLMRYHQGQVTSVNHTDDDEVTISGHHTKVGKGWKMIGRLNNYNFEDIPLEDIRLAPSALDFINALAGDDIE